MTDKELLELAAKAAGLDHPLWNEVHGYLMVGIGGNTREWNPLQDDGDAFRLAVNLRLHVDHHPSGVTAWIVNQTDRAHDFDEDLDDPCAATRRAIVRAAAEIGKTHD